MKLQSLMNISVLAGVALGGCTNDVPMVNLGIDDEYYVNRMQKLELRPALTGEAYRWMVDGKTVSDEREYVFLAREEGRYEITFGIMDPETPFEFTFVVNVVHEEVEYSPYISKVYEYCPAPGQFVNEMPQWEAGDGPEEMRQKAEDCISGPGAAMISLGGYGGYVTFGFDHTVVNVPGEADLRLWGNCFYELTDPEHPGGSAEPGIVMVSYDVNCNGLPDDPWYELAGSEYHSPDTRHGYTIRYAMPATDRDDIMWSDSEGATGCIPRNQFHTQPYYPRWVTEDLVFEGSLLAPNGEDRYGDGSYYVLYSYPWGYADNHPNDEGALNSFDISDAVNPDGTPANLPGADFVRVYTAVNQVCGRLGETSTEIARAQDLHIEVVQGQ